MKAIAETLNLVSRMQLKTEKELAALTRSVRNLENHNGEQNKPED